MCASLEHRGPDDSGFFTAPGVGLAMRRLSVIDLDTGHQPIANEDGTIHVVLNGEIYNYQDLTAELKRQGHTFSTRSDTETLVHLYEEHGLDFVNHLRGMFAIALWDGPRQRLVLARDRIGEKPLYYQHDGGTLLFGSEPKAILQRGTARNVDAQAVSEFLAAGYVSAPRTFYGGMSKLAPGEMVVCESGRVEKRCYWHRGDRPDHPPSFDAARDQFSELVSDTVRLCLKSDVEVGGFLSGGVDSSLLVALMCSHAARVQTFSVGYRGQATGFNELQYAKRVANDLGTRHHELILGPLSSINLLPRILWHYDEPHGEPTSVLVYLLCQFTSRFVKVAVGGTGGDEVFFGYPRHQGIRLLEYYRRCPRPIRRHLVERVVMRWPESTRGSRFAKRAKRFVTGADLPPEEAYISWVSLLQPEVRAAVLSRQIREDADDSVGESVLRRYLTGDGELLDRAADLDVGAYLPEYQLAYMDRMSMAHGLETRSPLCDYRLVDYVTSLPASYRLRGLHSKHLLKRVARQWIPRAIVERRKVGFDSPIGQWLKNELREFAVAFLSRENLDRSGLLSFAGVQQMLNDHFAGRRDYSLQLWMVIMLEGWYRMYIEDRVTDGSRYSLNDLRGAGGRRSSGSLALEHARSGPTSIPRRVISDHGSPLMRRRLTRRNLWERLPTRVKQVVSIPLSILPPGWLLGTTFRQTLRFVHEVDSCPAEESRAYQLHQIQLLCKLAYERSAYYRRRFDEIGFRPEDLKSFDDLKQLPTIDKGTLRESLSEMCTVTRASVLADRVATGGTGGEPLQFYIGRDRSAIEYAYLVASWQRVGYELNAPMAVFRGRVVPPRADDLRHEYDRVLKHHYYSTFHMTDDNMRRYLEHIDTIGPCFLHGYPSSVNALARFVRRHGIVPPPGIRGIIVESENVYSEKRRLAEETFNTRYFSCYGHSEKLVLATECEYSNDYHVWPTYGYFELLDDDGEPVTTPGERGEIVGTGFMNTVVPFIRYRTGDYARYVGDCCPQCGREHTVISDVRGHRLQEGLIARDGSEVPWVALNMHDDTFGKVLQFQFRQSRPGYATLRVVPGDGFAKSDEQYMLARLNEKLEGRVVLDVALCDAIPLTPQGKAVYVDQRISEMER